MPTKASVKKMIVAAGLDIMTATDILTDWNNLAAIIAKTGEEPEEVTQFVTDLEELCGVKNDLA